MELSEYERAGESEHLPKHRLPGLTDQTITSGKPFCRCSQRGWFTAYRTNSQRVTSDFRGSGQKSMACYLGLDRVMSSVLQGIS